LAFAGQLPGLAHAAIDVSDGLLQDLNHILLASDCGATIWYDKLPLHAALQALPEHWKQKALLSGGDVYQVCFTAPRSQRTRLQQLAAQHNVTLSRIGQIDTGSQLQVVLANGQRLTPTDAGFDH